MSDEKLVYKSRRAQLSKRTRWKKNRVEAAVETARRAFRRREPGTPCEVEKLDHLSIGSDTTCRRRASWLAVYKMEPDVPLQAIFLCDRCKEEVRKLLRYGYNEHHSFVLVKDWRLAKARRENAGSTK